MTSDEYESATRPNSECARPLRPIPFALLLGGISDSSELGPDVCITLVDKYANHIARLNIERSEHDLPEAGISLISGRPFLVPESEADKIQRQPWLSFLEAKQEVKKRGASQVSVYQTKLPPSIALVSSLVNATFSSTSTIVLQLLLDPSSYRFIPDDYLLATFKEIVQELLKADIILSILPLPKFEDPTQAFQLATLIAKNLGASDITIFRDEYPPHVSAAFRDLSFQLRVPIIEALHPIGFTTNLFRMKSLGDSEGIVNSIHPSAIASLRRILPPLSERGLVVMFVGLSGSGKTTLAIALRRFMSNQTISHLDGDEMRSTFSQDLGYDLASRLAHIRRMILIATEIAKHGGTVFVSTVAPTRDMREEFRESILEEALANFRLVHVNTSYTECSQRDPKGLYRRAESEEMQGINTPFQKPGDDEPHINLDGGDSIHKNVKRVYDVIKTLLPLG